MPPPANRNYAFTQAFVEELSHSGLHHACICPGSRSTPLVVSLARETDIKIWIHLDERSAAYFALGISRALREPVAVISTSGTGAANFFPAVVEAHYSQVPMLIVTADRPPELWEWGANQTIDQSHLYGRHSKWFVNMAPPAVSLDLLRYVREVTCRLLSTAVQSPAGPVHVNFPFGEPLVPKNIEGDLPKVFRGDQHGWEGRKQGNAYTSVESSPRSVGAEKIKEFASSLGGLRSGIIVCGPQQDPSFPAAVSTLAKRLGFPILADPLSQVRCGAHDRGLVIDSYDAFLRSKKIAQSLVPDVILRFGATPTSKALQNYCAQHHRARQILIREGDWQDPMHTATDVVQADPNLFSTALAAASVSSSRDFSDRLVSIGSEASKTIRKELSGMQELFEGKVFEQLANLIVGKAMLFAGNSMPVRDLDAFYPASSQQVRFLANRGASGIDGVMSAALGASSVMQEPTVLVLGDLSFYHDMNGLLAAKQYAPNTTIVLVNNNGGGIFSFLPQRDYQDYFEKYFATPHGLTFEAAASLYGLTYSKARSWDEFRGSVSRNIGGSGTAIVEIQTNREENLALHRRIWSAVAAASESKLVELT